MDDPVFRAIRRLDELREKAIEEDPDGRKEINATYKSVLRDFEKDPYAIRKHSYLVGQ